MEKRISTQTKKRILDLIVAESHPYPVPSAALLTDFIEKGRIINLKRGAALISEGDLNPKFYILIEGIMRKWHWDNNTEVTSAFALPGTQILDYHCYHANKNSQVNIEACCKSSLLEVKKEDYDYFLTNSFEFSDWRLHMAYNQLYYLEKKQQVIRGDARERYIALVKDRKEILEKVPLKIIATYIGVTPQYLSYLRKNL